MRKVIIDQIIAIAGNRLDGQDAVAAAVAALERQRASGKASLDMLIKVIKEERKCRPTGEARLTAILLLTST
jgi:hypothetical protein